MWKHYTIKRFVELIKDNESDTNLIKLCGFNHIFIYDEFPDIFEDEMIFDTARNQRLISIIVEILKSKNYLIKKVKISGKIKLLIYE